MHAQYTQSGIAADPVSGISQLTAEMLAAPDDDNEDPFLTSNDDDDDEFELNGLLTVKDTDWLHWVTYFYNQLFTVHNKNMWFVCVATAFQSALLNVIVLGLI